MIWCDFRTKKRESRMASQTRSPVKVGFIFSLLRGRVHQYCNGTLLWQIQVVNIVRKQNTWRWRAEGRGYCQGSPGRRWRGWRHHWCRTPTASPPRRRPSGPITAAQAHIPTDAELKVRFNFLGIPVNWSCLTLVTMWYGSLDHINVKGHQDTLEWFYVWAFWWSWLNFTLVHFWSPTFSASLLSQLSENQLCRQVFRFPLFES